MPATKSVRVSTSSNGSRNSKASSLSEEPLRPARRAVAVRSPGTAKFNARAGIELPIKQGRDKAAKYSYKMPKSEHEVIVELQKKFEAQDIRVKKSELIRAGIQLLLGLSDARAKASLQKIVALRSRGDSKAKKS